MKLPTSVIPTVVQRPFNGRYLFYLPFYEFYPPIQTVGENADSCSDVACFQFLLSTQAGPTLLELCSRYLKFIKEYQKRTRGVILSRLSNNMHLWTTMILECNINATKTYIKIRHIIVAQALRSCQLVLTKQTKWEGLSS